MRSGVLMVAVIIFPHNVIQVQQLKKMIVGRRRSALFFHVSVLRADFFDEKLSKVS